MIYSFPIFPFSLSLISISLLHTHHVMHSNPLELFCNITSYNPQYDAIGFFGAEVAFES